MKIQTPKVMEEPRDDNLVIKLWHQLVTNNLLVVHFFEFMKLVQMVNVVQIVSNVKDEITFSM
jgi:hypothetical protein